MKFARKAFPSAVAGFFAISAAHAVEPCERLAGLRIAPREIALPSRGAHVDTAATFPAEADLPAMCRVNGEIVGASAGAPPIKFQINLPVQWNGKALQFGGGGFNGVLIDGLRSMPGVAQTAIRPANPLMRGFVTFGSDGGHQATNPIDATFGRNPEARENYMGAGVKRLHDAALAIIRHYYGRVPRRMYFAGGSKGGHEGLVAAQRYGRDYDGVISYYPAKDSVGLILAWGVLTEAAYGPGAVSLSVKKQRYIQEATMDACDTLDGLKDGIIANTAACAATISPVSLACKPDDDPGGECLTVAETATLSAGLRRTPYPYPLANGVSALGPFPVMSGGTFEGSWISQGGRAVTAYDFLTNGIVRNFWTEDAQARFGSLDFAALRETIRAHSQASDATSADLDAFAGHGGKLILVQGSLDMLVPPSATTDYFLRVAGRYGDRSDNIVRYFVQPGYGHGTGEFNLSWDSLGALDSWVDTGAFPKYPVATDGNPATRNRQMPLCEYPLFPRYISGDASKATSFRCEAH